MLTISMEDSAIIRCIKYGYNLTNKKDRKKAANCKDYTSNIHQKYPQIHEKPKTKPIKKQNLLPLRQEKETNGWFYGSNHPTP